MIKIPIIIPSYKPDDRLVILINDLLTANIENIIVVRDGGGKEYDKIYEEIKKISQCSVIIHSVNLGKGRAIKTAINHYLEQFSHLKTGIVLADADGQHLVKDIIKVAETLEKNPKDLIIGARQFDKTVPFRSKFGNIISKYVFSFLLGRKISDTQSGLRGLPHDYLANFIKLLGEKYEYETNILIATRKQDIKIIEIPIETVYIDGNKSSHFNPLIDSIKIYWLLLKYSIFSILSFALDYSLFFVFEIFFNSIGLASYLSRGISLFFNYQVNKSIVFKHFENPKLTFLKYLGLCLCSISISYFLVTYLVSLKVNLYFAKIVVELPLFFFNFYFQNRYIFNKNKIRKILT